MNKNTLITLILVLLLVVTVGILVSKNNSNPQDSTENNDGNSSEQVEADSTQIITDPELGYSISYPETFTALSEAEQDILPSLGYVPPCDENHSNCLYYIGTEFEGTNFDSAGISTKNLIDTGEENCTSFNEAYTLPDSEISTEEIDSNLFYVARSGNAGAGHMAEETLYRTYHSNTCVEITTRIGYSQFGNYPEGSVEEFTAEDKNELMNSMKEVVHTLKFQK